MSLLILTDNKNTFKTLEEQINEVLVDALNFSDFELDIISSYWQRMGDLLANSHTIRWQKLLKDIIVKFPGKFTQLTCKTILNY